MKIHLLKSVYVKLLNNIKLRNKLILSFSILAILPLMIVGALSTHFSKKYLLETETRSLVQSMHQLNNSLDYFFATYMDRTNMVFNSEELQEVLQTNADNIDVAVSTNKKVIKLLSYIENDFKYPEMSHMLGSGGGISTKLYLSNDTVTSYGIAMPIDIIRDEKWLQNLFKEQRAFLWHYGEADNGKSSISLTRRLVNFETSKDSGLLQLFIPTWRISTILENNLKGSNVSVFYLDENSNIIATAGDKKHNNEYYYKNILQLNINEGVSPAKIGDVEFLVGSMTSTSTKWKVLYLIPQKSITGKTNIINLITFVAILAAIMICVIIAYGISTIITKRIKILLDKTNEIDGNNLTTSLVVGGNDEISKLDRNFDKMISRIRNLIENEYLSKITINQTKLELLQEQINPHLLYNTLSMVASTAEQAGQQDIMNLSENLSAFYRGVLNRGKIVCRMKEEIEMVKRYVEITKFVYKIDIDIIFDVDDEFLDLFTLKLLIQPVVENSILHGIRPKKEGTIAILGSVKNDEVVLSISDDGIGMDKDMVRILNEITSKSEFDKSYGITNVNRRIKMLLGEDYGLRYSSTPNEGTTVNIKLPRLTLDNIDSLTKDH
jgi:sensor histidine kinase YesM